VIVNEEQVATMLEGQGWEFKTSPRSNWIVVKRHGHIVAARTIYSLARSIATEAKETKPGNAPEK
jgi:hypothetical protein